MSVNGLVICKPTTVDKAGGSSTASIGANGKVTFSSCVTLSLNGVFTSSYDNYMITFQMSATTTDNFVYRLRSGGIDTATSTYTRQFIYANGTSVTGSRATTSYAYLTAPYNTQRTGTTVYLFGPFLSQPTAVRSVTVMDVSSAGIYDNASTQSGSTSFDGISFFFEGGGTPTFTGTLTVYGFNQ